ncbi:MAG: phosphotransferase enzyme family protein, partial [Pseudomonadales bacterium]
MANFYDLNEAQQVERLHTLAAVALQDWSIENADIRLLKHRENSVFAVVTPAGERFALRVHRHQYHSDAALRSELQWMAALNDAGVFTPQAIPSRDGSLFEVVQVDAVPEPRQCDLLTWVDGNPLGSIEEGKGESAAELSAKYEIVGELAAQVHNQAASWELPQGFERHAWDVDGLVGENPFWGRFWELPALNGEQRELIQRARQHVAEVLTEFGLGSDRYSLIHADFLPENLMVNGSDIQLIDFDDSGFGWHLFEFATSLFFDLGEDHFDTVFDAMVRGYRKHRELPDAHLELMPVFFMARA